MNLSEYTQRKKGILLDKNLTSLQVEIKLFNNWIDYVHGSVASVKYVSIPTETPTYRIDRNDPNFDRPYNQITKNY